MQTLIFFYRISSRERFLIKYEKFASEVNDTFETLNAHLFESELNGKQKLSTEVSHAIGGSPSRFKSDFSEIRIDESWRNDWSEERKDRSTR